MHDGHFIRDIKERLSHSKTSIADVTVLGITRGPNGYSVFGSVDIDDVCCSPYYWHHRLVTNYVDGKCTKDAREVAKALRPLLEGYYQRRFPGRIPRGMMFGSVIGLVEQAARTDPLAYLQPILADLRDMNEYARQFHHDTEASFGVPPVVDSEFLRSARLTLDLIYRNGQRMEHSLPDTPAHQASCPAGCAALPPLPQPGGPHSMTPPHLHRHSIRLQGYDYAQAGAYFVTIVTHERECVFGAVVDNAMQPNDLGDLVTVTWHEQPRHFAGVECGPLVLMPNHLHAILVLFGMGEGAETAPLRPGGGAAPPTTDAASVGAGSPRPSSPAPPTPVSVVVCPTLGQVVAYLKYRPTKRINAVLGAEPDRIWQRNYCEHVIRNHHDYERILRYMEENPLRRDYDPENPARVASAGAWV